MHNMAKKKKTEAVVQESVSDTIDVTVLVDNLHVSGKVYNKNDKVAVQKSDLP